MRHMMLSLSTLHPHRLDEGPMDSGEYGDAQSPRKRLQQQ